MSGVVVSPPNKAITMKLLALLSFVFVVAVVPFVVAGRDGKAINDASGLAFDVLMEEDVSAIPEGCEEVPSCDECMMSPGKQCFSDYNRAEYCCPRPQPQGCTAVWFPDCVATGAHCISVDEEGMCVCCPTGVNGHDIPVLLIPNFASLRGYGEPTNDLVS
jgi:hypothetical protein